MRKFIAVVTREFRERVRTRAFVISTVLIPLFFTLMIAGQIVLSTRGAGTWRIAVVDAAQGSFGARIEAALRDAKVGSGASAAQKYRVERIIGLRAAQFVLGPRHQAVPDFLRIFKEFKISRAA